MSADPLRSGLAAVTSGWTGGATITVGAVVATVTTRARTSAVEVIRDLVRTAERIHGGTWKWWATAAGKLVVTSTLTFALAATGNTDDRTGFTGTYTGAASYTAAVAYDGAVYPSIGLRLDGAAGVSRSGAVGASGATVMAITRQDQSGKVVMYGTFAELVALVDTFDVAGTWDVNLAGIWAARVRVTSVGRNAWGIRPDKATLELGVTAVTL